MSTAELAELRTDIKAGRRDLDVAPATFSVSEVAAIEAVHDQEIEALRATRRAAFGAERDRWVAHA